jgi:hypothetical protein
MNKILIKVIVPLVEEKYEVFVPSNKRISLIIKLIVKVVNELTNGYYPLKEDALLINKDTGNLYDVNITVKDAKILNGSEVILI